MLHETGTSVVMDATLIRGTLVSAFMRLAGDANWWAPGPLRRLHEGLGIGEAPSAEAGGSQPGLAAPEAVQP